ncbi:MAG: TolC family protein [Magnetococcales bacterium]|nr:TolC family protein [Magnetococcales bacterium]
MRKILQIQMVVMSKRWKLSLSRVLAFSFCVGLLLAPNTSWSGKNVHLPFLFSLQQALSINPAIMSAQDQVNAQREQLHLDKIELLPDMSLNLSSKYNHNILEYNNSSSSSNATPIAISLDVTHPLIDFNKWRTAQNAPLAVKRAEMNLLISAEKVFFNVVQETINILQSRAVLERSHNNLKRAEEHLRATKLRYQAGELTKTDISQSESRIAAIQAELISTENQFQMSVASFEELVGGRAPADLTIPQAIPQIIAKMERERIDIVDSRADVVLAAIQLEEAEKKIESEQSGLLPVVSLNANASRTWENNTASSLNATDDVSFTLQLSIPIDARGKYASKGRKAVWQRDEKKAKLDGVRQSAMREVKHALLGLRSAKAKYRALKKAEKAALTALSGVQKEFVVGTRSSPDLLDAQNDIFSVRRDLVKSHYAIILEQYKLIKAKGHLKLSNNLFDFSTQASFGNELRHNLAMAEQKRDEFSNRDMKQMLDLDLDLAPNIPKEIMPEPEIQSKSHVNSYGLRNFKPRKASFQTANLETSVATNSVVQPTNSPDINTTNLNSNNIKAVSTVATDKTIAYAQKASQAVVSSVQGLKPKLSKYQLSGIKATPAVSPGFVVHFSSYPKDQERQANELAQLLVKQFFPVIKTAQDIQGVKYIHLSIGPFAQFKEAEQVQGILESLYNSNPVINDWDPSTIPGLLAATTNSAKESDVLLTETPKEYASRVDNRPVVNRQNGLPKMAKIKNIQKFATQPTDQAKDKPSTSPQSKVLPQEKTSIPPQYKKRFITTASGVRIGVGRKVLSLVK